MAYPVLQPQALNPLVVTCVASHQGGTLGLCDSGDHQISIRYHRAGLSQFRLVASEELGGG